MSFFYGNLNLFAYGFFSNSRPINISHFARRMAVHSNGFSVFRVERRRTVLRAEYGQRRKSTKDMISHGPGGGARRKGYLVFVEDNASVVQLHDAVRHIVVAVVVTDDDYAFPLCFQRWQDIVIKNSLEVRVLVSGPLVKYIDGTIFEVGS